MFISAIKRGQIWYADLSPVKGSEQGGFRPVVIIQNDIGNAHSPTTIIANITSKMTKAKLPTHIEIARGQGRLPLDSIVLCEQLRTIDKSRLQKQLGELDKETMDKVMKAVAISLGMV